MKKILVIAVIVIVAAVLLIPSIYGITDGGSMLFETPLYSVTKYHMLDSENQGEYLEGWHVEILGIEIYHHLQ